MKLAIILLALLGLACAAPVRERRSDMQAVAELERALSSLLVDEQAKQKPPPKRVDGGTGGPGTPGGGGLEGLLFSLLAANQDGDTGGPSTTGRELADAEGWRKKFSKVKNGIKKGAKILHKGAKLYDKYGHLIPVMQEEEEEENENENLMPLLSLLLSAQQDNNNDNYNNNNNPLLALLQEEKEENGVNNNNNNDNPLLALLQEEEEENEYSMPLLSLLLSAQQDNNNDNNNNNNNPLLALLQEEKEENGDNNNNNNDNPLLALLQDDSFPAEYEAPGMELAETESFFSNLKKIAKKGFKIYKKYHKYIPAALEDHLDTLSDDEAVDQLLTYLLVSK